MNMPGHSVGSEVSETQAADAVTTEVSALKQQTRRRFIRGAGLAVPVIMTVQSPSALAAGKLCFAPSAAASIVLLNSRLDRDGVACAGLSPVSWSNAANNPGDLNHEFWVAAGGEGLNGDGVLFSSVFGSGFDGKTLKDVLNTDDSADVGALGRHLVASYLNLQSAWIPPTVFTQSDLVDMWNGRTGSYEPTAGVKWATGQIVDYLKTTMR